jgi:urease accessory protein
MVRLPAPLLLLACAAQAQAHTAAGMNRFTGGALHPLTMPLHVLILLGLGLLLGQHAPLRMARPLCVFAPAVALALALTPTGWVSAVHPAVLAGIALASGIVVAVGRRIPSAASASLLAAGAFAMGLDSMVESGGPGDTAAALAGSWCALVLALVNVAFYASLAAATDRKWVHTALRVVGSWIAAISLLLLAFSLRK